MFDVNNDVISVFSLGKGPKSLKHHNDVLMTSNCKFMLLFKLSGPNLAYIKFQLNIFTND